MSISIIAVNFGGRHECSRCVEKHWTFRSSFVFRPRLLSDLALYTAYINGGICIYLSIVRLGGRIDSRELQATHYPCPREKQTDMTRKL